MSGRRGSRKSLSSPFAVGKICQKQGDTNNTTTTIKPCDFNIILPKELRPLPCQGFFFWGYRVCKLEVEQERLVTDFR